MKRRTCHTLLTALAAGLLLFAHPAPVAAQHAAGDGRALDANPEVGSGGVNTPTRQIDFRARNDVITGNVGAGRAFRDTVGYRAAGEFSGALGSDDLFRFRADSLSSGLDRLNAVQSTRDYATGHGTSVYRLHTSPHVSTDTVTTRLVPDDVSIGGYYEPQPTFADPLSRTRPIGAPLDDRELDERGGLDPQGRALEQRIHVSPLLGIREDRRAPLWDPAREEREEAEEAEAERARLDEPPDEARARLETRLPGRLLGEYLISPFASDRRGLAVPEAAGEDPAAAAQIERLRARLLETRWAARDAEPGEDVYADLLAALRERQADDQRLPADRLVDPVDDETMFDLHEPSDRELERAEQEREAARERYVGGPTTAQREARLSQALEALLNELDYRLPRLESLAGERDDPVSELMRDAEQRLADGEYLGAERAYRQVLNQRREEPLARAGLVHAQLGAGMYRSAGMHLRHLLERYPELIAARYGARVLPGVERLQAAREQLERMSEGEDRAAGAAGLLLAYLGHQVESERIVRLGLARAEAHHPGDPLLPMLRRLWLGEAPENGEDPLGEPTIQQEQ